MLDRLPKEKKTGSSLAQANAHERVSTFHAVEFSKTTLPTATKSL
jgi:hypothetical protein